MTTAASTALPLSLQCLCCDATGEQLAGVLVSRDWWSPDEDLFVTCTSCKGSGVRRCDNCGEHDAVGVFDDVAECATCLAESQALAVAVARGMEG